MIAKLLLALGWLPPVEQVVLDLKQDVRRLTQELALKNLECDQLALLNEHLRQWLLANTGVAANIAKLHGMMESKE